MIDFILHISEHLEDFLNNYGSWIYALLFLIIFCETGLVATPFLPGDSMLFTAGSLCAIGNLNVHFLFVLLTIAAILGDGVNFYIGQFFGEKLFKNPNSKIFKQSYLRNTENFYEKYGGKTIIIARFVPIIRTFAPFVAGMGRMNYARFLKFNVIGGIAWVFLFCYAGYYFGQMEVVKKNLALVLAAIIVISVIPAIVETIKIYKENKK